jgi:anti-sigma regulatory factor (Ser/Thr protein kinase)
MTSLAPRRLTRFSIASEPGGERAALSRVAESVAGLGLEPARLDRLKTAVAEAVNNAIEHGNHFRPEVPVEVEVGVRGTEVVVQVTDHGGGGADGRAETEAEAEPPDLDRKLSGEQSPRGWGLFLIRNMVDAVEVSTEGERHTVCLRVRTGT